MQLWADFYNPDSSVAHELVRYGLATIAQRNAYQPIYVGVCDYHGSLGSLLSDYGFAPITDRAKMVKPVMQWVRGLTLEPSLILKPTAPVIGAPFILPAPPTMPLPRPRVLMGSGAKGISVQAAGVHPAAQTLAQTLTQTVGQSVGQTDVA
jgi:hypothetical protein